MAGASIWNSAASRISERLSPKSRKTASRGFLRCRRCSINWCKRFWPFGRTANEMTAHRKIPRSLRLLRIYFRRVRICVWLVTLVLLGALLYFNQIGLPNFVKNPLLEKLRARGVYLQFTRLRLRFPHGLVADNVLFGSATNSASPALGVKEVQ